LATLLDPQYDHSIFVKARTEIAIALKKHGLELSAQAPKHVELEYLSIDVVAVWSGWDRWGHFFNLVISRSMSRCSDDNFRSFSSRCLNRLRSWLTDE
jgi:hypothetical protein